MSLDWNMFGTYYYEYIIIVCEIHIGTLPMAYFSQTNDFLSNESS